MLVADATGAANLGKNVVAHQQHLLCSPLSRLTAVVFPGRQYVWLTEFSAEPHQQ